MKMLKYLQNHLKRRVSTPYTQASLITRNMVYLKKRLFRGASGGS